MSEKTKHSDYENSLFNGLGISIMVLAGSILYICNVARVQNIVPGLKPYSWKILGFSILATILMLLLLNLKNIGKLVLEFIKLLFRGFKSNVKIVGEAGGGGVQNLTAKKKIKATGEPLEEGLPPISLLGEAKDLKSNIDKDLPKKVERAFETLELNVKVKNYIVGAAITKFTLLMDKTVRIKNLMAVKEDLALHLHVDSINLVSTPEGMALEVPNKERRMVFHRMVMESLRNEKFKELSIILGEKSTGEPFHFNLEIAPHLLVAGATGMGKSVCINTIICSFLMRLKPDELRLLLIDPKQVEFSMYESLPHLARPVVKGVDGGIEALKWCVNEMERRYKILQEMGVKKLHSIPVPKRPFPLLIIIVDELADLILSAGKEVDNLISRLAGKARAAGMHLILATQRPSADIISGLIRSNILGRIALKTDKAIESGIILDRNGAETLTGKGEMLVKLPIYSDLVRCQGSFIDDEDMEALVRWWVEQGGAQAETAESIESIESDKSKNKIVFNLADNFIENEKNDEDELDTSSVEYLLKYSICENLISNSNEEVEINIPPIRDLIDEFKDVATEWEVRQVLEKLKTEDWIQTVGSKKGAKNVVTLKIENAKEWLLKNGNIQ